MWKIQQISWLLNHRDLWFWFVCTDFVAVVDIRLLIITLIAFVFSGCVAVSNVRLLIICLNALVFSSCIAVFDFRLIIISLIRFLDVPSYGSAMELLCWWNLTVWRRLMLRKRVRLCFKGSVNVHGCSQTESGGWCRESLHTVSMSIAFNASAFSLIVKRSEFVQPTSS